MAIYRNISLSFWTDSKVDDDFTPEDKYFYLYLLTNPHTNICGCYEISTKQMCRETGYNEDTIYRLLARMEKQHGVVRYCRETKEVLILNWHKYNWGSSDARIVNVYNNAKNIQCDEFRSYLAKVLRTRYAQTWVKSIPYEPDTGDDKRSSAKYATWKKLVYRRDGYTCRSCGGTEGGIHAHHIKPWAGFPALRFDVSNGLTLCAACHHDMHRKK